MHGFCFYLPLPEEASSHAVYYPLLSQRLTLGLERWRVYFFTGGAAAGRIVQIMFPSLPTRPSPHSCILPPSPELSTHAVFNASYKWHWKNHVYSSWSISHWPNVSSTRSGNWLKVRELALVVWLSDLFLEPGTVWPIVGSCYIYCGLNEFMTEWAGSGD